MNDNTERAALPDPRTLARPLLPPVHILSRSDDVQLRLEIRPGDETLEIALFRKSIAELESFDAYSRTSAAIIVPMDRIPEMVEHLQALRLWWVTR